jgi:hypothetical protein
MKQDPAGATATAEIMSRPAPRPNRDMRTRTLPPTVQASAPLPCLLPPTAGPTARPIH